MNSSQIGLQSHTSATHFKNAMSSENARKSGRTGHGFEHSHTQSAAVVSIVKSSQDLSKGNLGTGEAAPQMPAEGIVFPAQTVMPDSKRERRN